MKTKTEQTYTAGEWKVNPDHPIDINITEELFLLQTQPINGRASSMEMKANALLIAAAPELLEAAKTMIEFLKAPMNLRAEEDLKNILFNMNEVIEKAEADK